MNEERKSKWLYFIILLLILVVIVLGSIYFLIRPQKKPTSYTPPFKGPQIITANLSFSEKGFEPSTIKGDTFFLIVSELGKSYSLTSSDCQFLNTTINHIIPVKINVDKKGKCTVRAKEIPNKEFILTIE